jgi:hypothetical protein
MLDAQQQSSLFLVLAIVCILAGLAIIWAYGDDHAIWRVVGVAVMLLGGGQFGALFRRKQQEALEQRERGARRR